MTGTAGGELTADDHEEDDEDVATGAFLLTELAVGGGCSGPWDCAFEAGDGFTLAGEDMAKGTVARGRKRSSQVALEDTVPKALV